MKIEGSNIVFSKADMESMFTEELTNAFLNLVTALDNKNISRTERKIMIPLEGSLWYGIRIDTKGVPNG